jgi:hypothetical protein
MMIGFKKENSLKQIQAVFLIVAASHHAALSFI